MGFLKLGLLMFSILLVAFPQQREQELQSRIEGLVLKATNAEPLAGAVVVLRREGSGPYDRQYTTTTTGDGRFTLKDIPKARYMLSASKAGFMTQEYGQKQANKVGVILDLTAPQVMRDIVVRMNMGGSISGRVYEQDGTPIESTMIVAFQKKYQRNGKSVLSQANVVATNDIGEYRMYWLPPGTYYLLAVVVRTRAPLDPIAIIDQSEESLEAFSPVFYPRGDDESQASALRIEPGSELRAIDFVVVRTKALRVKGHVVSASSGRPLVGAILHLRLQYVEKLGRDYWWSAETDSEGNFQFRNVPPGKYILRVSWTESGSLTMSTQRDLELADKEVPELHIVLQANSIDGRVIMERGEPVLQNGTVLLFVEGDGTALGTGLQPDGTFSLPYASTGRLYLELTGLADNFFLRSARVGNKDVSREGLSLDERGADSLEVVIGSEGATVAGIVTDDHQTPVMGARVVLMPDGEHRDRPDLVKAVTTDRSGQFAIRGAMPGNYKIFCWDDLEPNIYFDPSFIQQYESQGKALHLNANDSITVNLRPISIRAN